MEMNLSETAFLYPAGEGYNLRWFTPVAEVEMCGHATLATAHVLYSDGHVRPNDGLKFQTLSGELRASRRGEWIELDFPAIDTLEAEAPPELLEALGVKPVAVRKGSFDYLVELDSEATLRSLKPNLGALAKLESRGLIVTAKASTEAFDFVSRCFFPAYGIDEDPVTGSAHCALATYWSDRLHKSEFRAFQASARGGILKVRLDGDRVFLGGQAVTVMRADLI
jgi:PhzF family phenazine biosynthesis protein